MKKHDRRKQISPPHRVFQYINMHGGDKSVCWEWLGTLSPAPIFCWNKKRWQARRMVYSLRHGIHYDRVPKLTTTCQNNECCNPDHIIKEKDAVLLTSRIRCDTVDHV